MPTTALQRDDAIPDVKLAWLETDAASHRMDLCWFSLKWRGALSGRVASPQCQLPFCPGKIVVAPPPPAVSTSGFAVDTGFRHRRMMHCRVFNRASATYSVRRENRFSGRIVTTYFQTNN